MLFILKSAILGANWVHLGSIRQRGVGNPNAVKLGRCIKELERIYGIRNGGDRKSEETKLPLKSQGELAEEFDMSKVQLRKYKSLADLIPELQDAVQSGKVTTTTAMGFVKKLSEEEQKKPFRLRPQCSGFEAKANTCREGKRETIHPHRTGLSEI